MIIFEFNHILTRENDMFNSKIVKVVLINHLALNNVHLASPVTYIHKTTPIKESEHSFMGVVL